MDGKGDSMVLMALKSVLKMFFIKALLYIARMLMQEREKNTKWYTPSQGLTTI